MEKQGISCRWNSICRPPLVCKNVFACFINCDAITCLVIHQNDKSLNYWECYVGAILELYHHKRSTCPMMSLCLYVQMQMYGGNWWVHGMREEHQISGYQVTEKCHAQTGNKVIYLHQVIEVCKCYQNNVSVNISYHSFFCSLVWKYHKYKPSILHHLPHVNMVLAGQTLVCLC